MIRKFAGGVEPEIGEFVIEAVWGGDDSEFLHSAEWVGDTRVNGAPDRIRVFVKSKFGQDEITRVAADGGSICGESDQAGAVGPFNLGAR